MAERTTATPMQVTVVACMAPRQVREWVLEMPAGSTVRDALQECGLEPPEPTSAGGRAWLGIWGRTVAPHAVLQQQDRVEIYRPLLVDPKVARRQRFARQGARTTGLFARQRPGAKAGY